MPNGTPDDKDVPASAEVQQAEIDREVAESKKLLDRLEDTN